MDCAAVQRRPVSPRRRRGIPALAVAVVFGGCAQDGNGAGARVNANAICEVVQPPTALSEPLDESSGLAIGRADSEVLWTHNDSGGEPELYAITSDGRLIGTVRVSDARNRDWEDLSAGRCPAGNCLYVGDIGDNSGTRDEITVYRVPEPGTGDGESQPAERFRARYPGGPRDAESLFVLPTGELYIVTKGRTSNVAVFRYPQPFRAEEIVELEHVADLSASRADLPQQITAAEASPNGKWVAIRSYAHLMLFRTADLLAGQPATSVIDLAALGEPQGEAVAIRDDGLVVLTSEASGEGPAGTITLLRCSVTD